VSHSHRTDRGCESRLELAIKSNSLLYVPFDKGISEIPRIQHKLYSDIRLALNSNSKVLEYESEEV